MNQELLQKIRALPLSPGCYLFRNEVGQIIYIGKSKALRNRVRSYFQSLDKKESKLVQLAREASDLDCYTTDTETDALLLECHLIKKHRPRYNAQYMTDRRSFYIAVEGGGAYPSIHTTAEPVADARALHIGPFPNPYDAQAMLSLIGGVWHTPMCDRATLPRKACLFAQTAQCCAPCVGRVSPEAYARTLRELRRFFEGDGEAVLRRLQRDMQGCASSYRFEEAAARRNEIQGLEMLMRRHRRINVVFEGRDVYAFVRAYREPIFHLFFVRDGVALHRAAFASGAPMEEARLLAFLEDVRAGRHTIEDGRWIATSLQHVAAEKLFVYAPRLGIARTAALLERERAEFETPFASHLGDASQRSEELSR